MNFFRRLPGKVKGLFFLFRLDIIIPVKLLHFTAYVAELSKWIAVNKKRCENDFYSFKFKYSKRETLYETIITRFDLDSAIDYFEFGVARGVSFKWWISRLKHPDARFYGFDTFTGLPEDWGPFKKGDMSNGNAPPVIEDDRHSFYQGLFQQTLLPFLKNYKPNKRKVIHMDADIYSSTLFVLTTMAPYINPGDIIFFDEFSVPLHEFKAFTEWTHSFYIDYEVLGGVNNFYQTAVMIK